MAEEQALLRCRPPRAVSRKWRASQISATPGTPARVARRQARVREMLHTPPVKGPGGDPRRSRGHAQVRGARNRPVRRAGMRPDRRNRMVSRNLPHNTRTGRPLEAAPVRADHATFAPTSRPSVGGSRWHSPGEVLGPLIKALLSTTRHVRPSPTAGDGPRAAWKSRGSSSGSHIFEALSCIERHISHACLLVPPSPE